MNSQTLSDKQIRGNFTQHFMSDVYGSLSAGQGTPAMPGQSAVHRTDT